MLAMSIDVELDDAAVGPANFLRFKVDRQRGVGAAIGVVHQLLELFRRDLDGQDAVLEAVVVEDVGKARRNYAADAEVEQRPRRMLAARPAAEVFAGDEDLSLAISRLVQHEIWIFLAGLIVADLGEQCLA